MHIYIYLCNVIVRVDVVLTCYYTSVISVAANVSLVNVERNLKRKSLKVTRRPGDAKVPLTVCYILVVVH